MGALKCHRATYIFFFIDGSLAIIERKYNLSTPINYPHFIKAARSSLKSSRKQKVGTEIEEGLNTSSRRAVRVGRM